MINDLEAMPGFFIVEPLAVEKETSSGLIIAQANKKEVSQKGVVVKAGSNDLGVKENDLVLFKQWGGYELKLDGKEYQVLTADDLLAKFKKGV